MKPEFLKTSLAPWIQLGVQWGIRLGLGLTFVWASVHKIADPGQFAKIIYGYDVFPAVAINALAILVPYVELVAGISLITGVYKRSGLIILNMLLLAFILVIGFNLLRGHEFDCGCFSYGATSGQGAAMEVLIRDVLLLGAGLYLWKKLNQIRVTKSHQ